MAQETAQQKMARAMSGPRFTKDAGIALEDLRPIAGTVRAHRVALHAAHAEMARTLVRLQRDRDRGEIGPEKYDREVRAAKDRAIAVVQERTDKIRALALRALTGFETRWNPVSNLVAKASQDGSYAAFLKTLPADAQEAEVQRLIHARDTEKLATAALVLEDLRADIVASVAQPDLVEARTHATAVEREFNLANAWREAILKGESSPVNANREHVISQAAKLRFGATDSEAIDVASRPRTDESIRDYTQANDRLNKIEAEIAAEPPTTGSSTPTTHSAPNGMATMRVALGGEQK